MTIKKQTKTLGNYGEQLVCTYLENKGYTIAQTQFKTSRGEVDIIAYDKRTLISVEVKTRNSASFATSAVITPLKQSKIVHATVTYCTQMHHKGNIRFDVALVTFDQDKKPTITYYENAFQSEESWLI